MVLEITIEARLGDTAALYDLLALVEGYVERFGFVDLDEVDTAEFEALAKRYLRS
jgi:hypothetical protein